MAAAWMLLLLWSGPAHSGQPLQWAPASHRQVAASPASLSLSAESHRSKVVTVAWHETTDEPDVFDRDDAGEFRAAEVDEPVAYEVDEPTTNDADQHAAYGETDEFSDDGQLSDYADRSMSIAALDDPFEEPGIDSEPEEEEPAADESEQWEVELPQPDELMEEEPFDDDTGDATLDEPEVFQDPVESLTEPSDDEPGFAIPETIPGLEETPLPETPEQDDWPTDQQYFDNLMAKERAENEKNCQEEYDELKAASIKSIDLDIRVTGNPGEDIPHECGLGSELFQPRQWPQVTYMWKASGLCHKPLYFEQVHLERYGHSTGPYMQPLVSGAHFFLTVPILPYKMGLKTPNECVYTLGYYRPGSCAPYMIDPVPFTWRAALFEAGAVVGAAAIVP